MSDQTLSAFGADTESTDDEGGGAEAAASEQSVASDSSGHRTMHATARRAHLLEPPARDCGDWVEHPDEEYGLKTYRFRSGGSISSGANFRFGPQAIRWISGGDLTSYLTEYGQTHLSIPESYGAFDEFDPYVAYVDSTLEHYGLGIDADALERALRVLTGGGRYSARKFRAVACGLHPWVLASSQGTVLCSLAEITRPSDTNRCPTSTLDTALGPLEIEEHNPTVRAGIKRLINMSVSVTDTGLEGDWTADVGDRLTDRLSTLGNADTLSHTPPDGTTHSSRHRLAPDDGRTIKVETHTLQTIGRIHNTPDTVQIALSDPVSPPNGDQTLPIDWTPEYDIGDTCRNGIVIGYEFDWESSADPREQTAVVSTYYLTTSRRRLAVDTYTRRFGTVLTHSFDLPEAEH